MQHACSTSSLGCSWLRSAATLAMPPERFETTTGRTSLGDEAIDSLSESVQSSSFFLSKTSVLQRLLLLPGDGCGKLSSFL